MSKEMWTNFNLSRGRIGCRYCQGSACLLCAMKISSNPESIEDCDSNDCACDETEYTDED